MSRQLKREDYTIGWICAIWVELAAAQQMLDEQHHDLGRDPYDDNSYVLGSMAGHNVAIVCLPRTGTNAAAATAMKMMRTFTNIPYVLMVGIGGGVPSVEDVRLGDIVVSEVMGISNGVIQYDSGKATPSGFERTGCLAAPPHALINAVHRLRANQYTGHGKLAATVAKFKRDHTFSRKYAGSDKLFHATYDHEKGQKSCDRCDGRYLQRREPRQSHDPAVHYGIIASGNTLIKNARQRDAMSEDLGGVLCFEMEAAGLMDYVPCLVVRGISDYADSHKNKKWQPYAAMTAAAYAKEVISFIPAERTVVDAEATMGYYGAAGLTGEYYGIAGTPAENYVEAGAPVEDYVEAGTTSGYYGMEDARGSRTGSKRRGCCQDCGNRADLIDNGREKLCEACSRYC